MKVLPLALTLGVLIASCEEPSEAQAPPPAPASQPALEALTDLTSTEVQSALRAAPGDVLLVNLWSTWCRPCMEEMPQLVSLAARHRAGGLGAMFISMDISASRAEALRFMVEEQAPSPSYIRVGRDADFIPAMHDDWSGTLPATILFDRSRTPRHMWVGEVPTDELESAVQRMLSEGNE
ncbi:MAG: thiol-disulfide isomerase/thioredoxin [Polyangiales bacterium]|jgi:thiol-disulfide isomerase/thioredoxin